MTLERRRVKYDFASIIGIVLTIGIVGGAATVAFATLFELPGFERRR